MLQAEIIVKVGCDGGSLTIEGKHQGDGGWQFRGVRNELALYDDYVEDGERNDIAGLLDKSNYSVSLREALKLFDRYPYWINMCVVEVHPDFVDEVLGEVRSRGGRSAEARWLEALDRDRTARPDIRRPRGGKHLPACSGCALESRDYRLDWTGSYYESLEFFYWEPQHLGRKKYANATLKSVDKVKAHLRKMEVTLNHNLHQFFLIAPTRLITRIFWVAFGVTYKGPFTLHGRNVDTEFRLQNSMQPDLLLTTEANTISVELKIDAKCSVSQVLKYALLGLAVELQLGHAIDHALLLVGRGEFRRQWHEQLSSCADLQAKVGLAKLDDFMGRQPSHFREHSARFAEIVRSLRFAYLDYEQFATVLRDACPGEDDRGEGAEAYRNLLSGMIHELHRRTLATPSKVGCLDLADSGVARVSVDGCPDTVR